jgi:hypothetical protein
MNTCAFLVRDQLDTKAGDTVTVVVRRAPGVTITSLKDDAGNSYAKQSEEIVRHPKRLTEVAGTLEFWSTTLASTKQTVVVMNKKANPPVVAQIHDTRITCEYEGDVEPTLHLSMAATQITKAAALSRAG